MRNKIIWILIIILLIGFGVVYKNYYPNSQLQLKMTLRHAIATPVEHFNNATEKSCGIWFERSDEMEIMTSGRANEQVKKCFTEAFSSCFNRNILLVQDNGLTDDHDITYSLIRIIKSNDQNECIIQNYYEQYDVSAAPEAIPLNFVNTCTSLEGDFMSSCEPLYIKELIAKRKLIN
jgi:hypothetical protein